jgi:hypothetical protein
VTMGAVLNVATVLGLTLQIQSAEPSLTMPAEAEESLPPIRLADYAQLKELAWNLPPNAGISAEDALGLYERNWRHLRTADLCANERALLDRLSVAFGGLLVPA